MIFFCVSKTFFKQWLKNWGIMPIQSEQKKIIIILKLSSVNKRNWCSYYVINSYMYSSIVSYAVPCSYWELLLHWTSSIIVDLSLSRPILRESTQIDYRSYTCRTHSDIWPLRILISGWLWNTCAVNQRDSSSSLH